MPLGGTIAECVYCGNIQKPLTEELLADIARIYAHYDVYYQGGGIEQIVHDSEAGAPSRRSDLLTRRLIATGLFSQSGRAIDLGCGNGAFIRALGAQLDRWEFYGLEVDRRHDAELHSIPGFVSLLTGDVTQIDEQFRFISMIHALEHLTDPFATLVALRQKLASDGYLFIQIPNVLLNPFDLLIADHISHMTPWAIEAMLLRAGYEIVLLDTDWVKKEISVVARPTRETIGPQQRKPSPELCARQIRWLSETLARAEAGASSSSLFGMFGTSIAATWLSGVLGDRIQFYLDDDPSRQARSFFGKKILAPSDAPFGATVFIGMAPIIAEVIAVRLQGKELKIVMPPPFGDS